VCVNPLVSIVMKISAYVMAAGPLSVAWFDKSVCLMYIPFPFYAAGL
jgi:hypothetical protein